MRWLLDRPVILTTPTIDEIEAGLALDSQLIGLEGFTTSTDQADVVSARSYMTTAIPGATAARGGTLTFAEKMDPAAPTDVSHDELMSAFTERTNGWLVIAPYGVAVGNDCEVWYCRATVAQRLYGMEERPAEWAIQLAVLEAPKQHSTIVIEPASTPTFYDDDEPTFYDTDPPTPTRYDS